MQIANLVGPWLRPLAKGLDQSPCPRTAPRCQDQRHVSGLGAHPHGGRQCPTQRQCTSLPAVLSMLLSLSLSLPHQAAVPCRARSNRAPTVSMLHISTKMAMDCDEAMQRVREEEWNAYKKDMKLERFCSMVDHEHVILADRERWGIEVIYICRLLTSIKITCCRTIINFIAEVHPTTFLIYTL